MFTTRKRVFASGAAAGALAMLLAGAGGYWAASAQAPSREAVNADGVAPGAPASFADIVAQVAPAVVSIEIVKSVGANAIAQEAPFPFSFGPQGPGGGENAPYGFTFKWVVPHSPGQEGGARVRASGSGFLISPDGYIVTNNHVVDGALKITVHTNDGRTFQAQVVGRDPATDLAVLKVAGGPFKYVSFENRAKPRVGDWVVAVGNPFGLGGTATAGIVSALGRQNVSGSGYVDFMQIDAPINQGNSGGPTFDVEGRVVGVNTAIFTPSGGSVGIGFDIPADVAASVTRQLIENGKVTRGYIGATIQTLTPGLAESFGLRANHGVIVDQLSPGGPADQAGLKSGDVILSVNGTDIRGASDLTRQVGMTHPGATIDLGVLSNGVTREVAIRSGLRPSEASLASNAGPANGDQGDNAAPNLLGMQLSPDPDGGLVVQGVDPSSDAASKGLREGDVILRAGDHPVESVADLSQAAREAQVAGRTSVPVLVARAGERMYVPLAVTGATG